MAHGTFLGEDSVLVSEEGIQLLVQTIVLMGQSATCRERRGNDQGHFLEALNGEITDLSHILDIKNCFHMWLPCLCQQ